MRRYIVVLVISSLALSFRCLADELAEQIKTLGQVNGRYWQSLSFDSKVTFLIAFDEGYKLAAPRGITWNLQKIVGDEKAAAVDKEIKEMFKLESYLPEGMSYGEIAKGVDRIYESPENLVIPVKDVLTLVTRKVHGASQADIDQSAARLRGFIHDIEEQRKKDSQK